MADEWEELHQAWLQDRSYLRGLEAGWTLCEFDAREAFEQRVSLLREATQEAHRELIKQRQPDVSYFPRWLSDYLQHRKADRIEQEARRRRLSRSYQSRR